MSAESAFRIERAAVLQAGLDGEAQGAEGVHGRGAGRERDPGDAGLQLAAFGGGGGRGLDGLRKILRDVPPKKGETVGRQARGRAAVQRGGLQGRLHPLGDRSPGLAQSRHVHERQVDGVAASGRLEDFAAPVEEAGGRGERQDFGEFEDEGLTLPGDGAGGGRSEIGKAEGAQGGAPDPTVRAAEEQRDGGRPESGAQIMERRIQLRAARGPHQVRQRLAAPAGQVVGVRTRARAERDGSVSGDFDQGVGRGEGEAEEARPGLHEVRISLIGEDSCQRSPLMRRRRALFRPGPEGSLPLDVQRECPRS
jgi:hypothetical protein